MTMLCILCASALSAGSQQMLVCLAQVNMMRKEVEKERGFSADFPPREVVITSLSVISSRISLDLLLAYPDLLSVFYGIQLLASLFVRSRLSSGV